MLYKHSRIQLLQVNNSIEEHIYQTRTIASNKSKPTCHIPVAVVNEVHNLAAENMEIKAVLAVPIK